MEIINFGLGLAQGILNVIAGATGSRGVALALGIVGTIGAAFANIGTGQPVAAPQSLLGQVPAQAATAANTAGRLPGPVQAALPGGA